MPTSANLLRCLADICRGRIDAEQDRLDARSRTGHWPREPCSDVPRALEAANAGGEACQARVGAPRNESVRLIDAILPRQSLPKGQPLRSDVAQRPAHWLAPAVPASKIWRANINSHSNRISGLICSLKTRAFSSGPHARTLSASFRPFVLSSDAVGAVNDGLSAHTCGFSDGPHRPCGTSTSASCRATRLKVACGDAVVR